jgi:hypothetical protein
MKNYAFQLRDELHQHHLANGMKEFSCQETDCYNDFSDLLYLGKEFKKNATC